MGNEQSSVQDDSQELCIRVTEAERELEKGVEFLQMLISILLRRHERTTDRIVTLLTLEWVNRNELSIVDAFPSASQKPMKVKDPSTMEWFPLRFSPQVYHQHLSKRNPNLALRVTSHVDHKYDLLWIRTGNPI